ncbi:hypothetical protein GQ53DRAFT_842162 [Thozetella sp. PMI_491]|nr:hypothetical protein GQ53DRAFT_842162 [Thozetella sp. PMI_491]
MDDLSGPPEPLLPGHISPTGLTVLTRPDSAEVDIVFVHGFTGHPERTWTYTGAAGAEAISNQGSTLDRHFRLNKLLKTEASSNGRAHIKKGTYWPLALVPSTIPSARVLTYGYDTNVRHVAAGPVSQNTLYDHAADFLAALEAERRAAPHRPLLFVAHSLGGLVVKETLRRSRGYHKQPSLRKIFEATVGVIFFGTPHAGADPCGVVHDVVISLAKAIGFKVNDKIVEALSPSAEYLNQLRDEFVSMIDERGWLVHSFQEQYALSGFFGKKVVEDASSCIRHPAAEIVQHIGRNHRDMCRFSGSQDAEYQKVAAALKRIAEHRTVNRVLDSPRVGQKRPRSDLNDDDDLVQVPNHKPRISSRSGRTKTKLSDEELAAITRDQAVEASRQNLLSSLTFRQIDSRFTMIERAHSKTCRWLLNESAYCDWLDAQSLDHHGFLWIKGKPGVGKSTIMKFALNQAKSNRSQGTIILHFFFNARGAELEKSTPGLYRSLLFQLFQSAPDMWQSLDVLADTNLEELETWHIQQLKELFRSAVERLGKRQVFCFVDALDECEEDQVRDMISYFQSLADFAISEGLHLRICFSSRHYPHITIDHGLTLVLEQQEGHDQDIRNYIASELRIGNGEYVSEVRQQLEEKSAGIFMWVILVVRILNKEYDRGNIYSLRKRLEQIPPGLYELFTDILTRDNEHLESLWLCIQWVLLAKRPMSREELYFAMLACSGDSNLISWDPKEISIADMGRFILSCSKGLTEVTKKTHTVQFIHESVRDFILKENGLSKIWPHFQQNFIGSGHDILKRGCEAQILAASGIQPRRFPFLKYAVRNVFHHSDTAHASGIDQSGLFTSFQLPIWIALSNALEQYPVRHYPPDAHLLYVLSEYNAFHLIQDHPEVSTHFEIKGGRCRRPLFVAMAHGHAETARILFASSLGSEHCQCGTNMPFNDINISAYGRDFGSESDSAALLATIDRDDKVTSHGLLRLLSSNFKDMPAAEQDAILQSAVRSENMDFFMLTLEHTFGAISPHQARIAVVEYAARTGIKECFEMMTGFIAPKEAAEPRSSPVSDHISRGMAGFTRFLGTGLTPMYLDVHCSDNRTPLSFAAEKGHSEICNILVRSRKVYPHSKSNHGRTPIAYATDNGHAGIVQMLRNTRKRYFVAPSRNINPPGALEAVFRGNIINCDSHGLPKKRGDEGLVQQREDTGISDQGQEEWT